MKKSLFLFALFVSLQASSVSAQTAPVQITGGKLAVFEYGESYIETTLFRAASNGAFGGGEGSIESVWYPICRPLDRACSGGTTFRLPDSTRVGENIGTSLPFRVGDFFANGTNHFAYYGGNLRFAESLLSESLLVSIPKFANLHRKGTFRITRPFRLLPSVFKACKVSTLNRPCPADQILFDGQIEGRGTLTITFEPRLYQHLNPQLQLYRKSFVYEFEP